MRHGLIDVTRATGLYCLRTRTIKLPSRHKISLLLFVLIATMALASISLASWLFTGLSCRASVKGMKDLIPEGYLHDQFQWTITLDLPDSRQYLNYPKSKLWPLTRVRADYKSNVEKDSATTAKTYYEELWYHDDVAVGLRRHNSITLPPHSKGAIVVCPTDVDADASRRAAAIAGSLIKLTLDVQFRNSSLGVVLVPDSDYRTTIEALQQRHFRNGDVGSFYPLSVHLLDYPGGDETTLYLQN